jgi:hypothetical protein
VPESVKEVHVLLHPVVGTEELRPRHGLLGVIVCADKHHVGVLENVLYHLLGPSE